MLSNLYNVSIAVINQHIKEYLKTTSFEGCSYLKILNDSIGGNKMFDKKSYRNPNNIAKRIDKLLNEDMYKDFLQNNGIDEISNFISNIMEYYIVTNDKKTNYNLGQINELINSLNTDDFDYNRYAGNPILANACNGYSKESIKKNGFKNTKFDFELESKMKYCEDVLGKSNYLEYQNTNDSNEDYLFFSFPGSLVIEYGMKMSPERLFMGILKQEYDNVLPYEVGEGKANYYKRVIRKKQEQIGLDDEKLIKYSDEIIDIMCSENPIINLFLSECKKNKIEAYVNFIGNGEAKAPIDISFVNTREDGQVCFFNGGNYSSNAANMVTSNLNIDKGEIGIINIQDYFTCLDMKANCLGYKTGQKINLLTMTLEQEQKAKESEENPNVYEKKKFYQNLRNYVISEANDFSVNESVIEDETAKSSDEQSKAR